MKKVSQMDLVRIAIRGIFKSLDDEKRLECHCSSDFEIEQKKSSRMIGLDGELKKISAPFLVKSIPKGLNLVVPESVK